MAAVLKRYTEALGGYCVKFCASVLLAFTTVATAQNIVVSGSANPGLQAIDQNMLAFMRKYNVSGAQVAMASNGSIILARGYGVADGETGELVQPDSLFRVASLSKSITGFTVLKLVEEGKIDLDRRAWDYLPHLHAFPGQTGDPRLNRITVRMLLNHTSGWDSAVFDPGAAQRQLVAQFNLQAPISSEDVVRVMLGRPLQYDPGTQYHYFNADYTILGRVIEATCGGLSYEQCAREKLLVPAGALSLRIGHTALEGRQPKEVRYYPFEPAGPTTFSFGPATLPSAYGGGTNLSHADAAGGWIATAVDLIRLYTSIQGRGRTALLTPASITELEKPANIPSNTNANTWYGAGLIMRKAPVGLYWGHDGGYRGTFTQYFRYSSTYDYVVFLNGFDDAPDGQMSSDLQNAIQTGLNTAVSAGFQAGTNLSASYPTSPVAISPYITVREGIVHGASFQRGVVSGSWLTILGNYLSTVTRTWAAADFVNGSLPEALDGVSVKINGQPAYPYFISKTQVNVLAPANLPEGWATVELTRSGRSSPPVLVEVRRNAPGFFQYGADTRTFLVAVHLDATVVGDANAVPGTRFASPGQRLLLFGTGYEPAPSGLVTTPPQTVAGAIVRFNNTQAVVEGTALISPGLFQTNIVVPQLANGDYDVTIEINGRKSPTGVVISVHN